MPETDNRANWPDWLESLDDRVATCRYCGAKVRWGTTYKGKKTPMSTTKTNPETGEMLSHWVDCPHANKARKK